MSPDRWRRIEELYHTALERPASKLVAFLDAACAGDRDLRQEVETLIAAHEEAGTFIDHAPDDVVAGMVAEEQVRSILGRTLGHYTIQAKIGAGGMGEVYRAHDTRLDRDVAVKILPEHLATDVEALRRFGREAKAVAALSHPNILAIFDFGTEEGTSYAVMELLEGETLRSRLTRGPLDWRDTVEIGTAIAEGLAAAHAKGIIHRDLKPENIFLTSSGLTSGGGVKILDFGIARVKQIVTADSETLTSPETTRPGTVMGTIGYMSPEQVRGETADAPSDIFSLGCVLYEMVSGRRPFAQATAAETIAAILKEEPPSLDQAERKNPSGLERLIRKCLEKQAAARLQSAHELGQQLKATTDGRQARHISMAQPRSSQRFSVWIGAATLTLLLGALGWLLLMRPEQAIDSLAVLPLANAGQDADAEYLSDGITESLINSLSQLPQLKRVIARSSVETYKGKTVDPRKVGQELNVRAVLTGKMFQRGDNLNIVAVLVNVADGARLWGEQYNRRLSELFTLQDEIARHISEGLRLRLSGGQQQLLAKHQTTNIEAHQLYLKGRSLWIKDTKEDLEKSIEFYKQAIAIDPSYSLAWVGIADSYFYLSGLYLASSKAMPKSREAALKALDLDNSLAEAHAALAMVKAFHDLEPEEGERAFRRAITLNPGYAHAHNQYGVWLTYQGRFPEAQVEMSRALELDPLAPYLQVGAVWPVLFARRYDQAIEQLRKIISLEPDSSNAYINLAWAYIWKGMPAEAFAPLEKAKSLDNFWAVGVAQGYAYAVMGQHAKARQVLAELRERAKREQVSDYGLAVIHAGLGEKDEALATLNRANQSRDEILLMAKVDPFLDSLRADPRFMDLLRKLKLTP